MDANLFAVAQQCMSNNPKVQRLVDFMDNRINTEAGPEIYINQMLDLMEKKIVPQEEEEPKPEKKMHRAKMGFGKKKDDVATPEILYKELDSEFKFDFDPCPKDCKVNNLKDNVEWGQSNFVNPPFSRINKFLKKAIKESAKGKSSVILMPARVNTKYWHKCVYPYASELRFLKGGVQFDGYDKPSPFPVSIVVIPKNARRATRKGGSKKFKWNTVKLT